MVQLGLMQCGPSVIMNRLWVMFSNANEVQGDSVPPTSATLCAAYNHLSVLGKLLWVTLNQHLIYLHLMYQPRVGDRVHHFSFLKGAPWAVMELLV